MLQFSFYADSVISLIMGYILTSIFGHQNE